MDPDPSVSIMILLLVPFIIAVNLLIALVLFFTKRRLSRFFLINALISAILMYFLFYEGISKHQRNRLERWEFQVNSTTYEIIHWKLENTFSMSKRNDSGSSLEFLEGKFVASKNEYNLVTDSTKYIIRKGKLYGFKNDIKGIILKKVKL